MLEKIGKNIGKNIGRIFLGIIAIALFIWGYQCGSGRSTPKTDSKTIVDTFVIKTTDTIKPPAEIKWYPSKPKVRMDTVIKPVYLDSGACNRIYVYEDTIRTKDYDLYRKSYIQGKLRFDTTGVKLKVPLIINNTITTTIRDSIFLNKNAKYQIQAGFIASPKMLAPTIDFSINRSTYLVGFDPFNKQPIIGFKYRLFSWTPKKK